MAKKDRIKESKEWVSNISKEMSRQMGSMGIEIIRPIDKESKLEYITIFRFNNYDNLRNGKIHPLEMIGYKKEENW